MVEVAASGEENAVALTGPQALSVPVLIVGAGPQAKKGLLAQTAVFMH